MGTLLYCRLSVNVSGKDRAKTGKDRAPHPELKVVPSLQGAMHQAQSVPSAGAGGAQSTMAQSSVT
jgi:hypothetical protein